MTLIMSFSLLSLCLKEKTVVPCVSLSFDPIKLQIRSRPAVEMSQIIPHVKCLWDKKLKLTLTWFSVRDVRLSMSLPLRLSLRQVSCLMFRAEHMGPLNSLLHALFVIALFIPTDSCVKRCLGARCEIVGSWSGPRDASVCLVWGHDSTL